MELLHWIGFFAFAIFFSGLAYLVRRFFGVINVEKFNQMLQNLSDQDLIRMHQVLDSETACRDDIGFTQALRNDLVRREMNRRRIGLSQNGQKVNEDVELKN